MQIINIHEAKTHLSRLIERATKGESFVIAKAGKPCVLVSAIEDVSTRRLGFMRGAFKVPMDFDTMAQAEIMQAFGIE